MDVHVPTKLFPLSVLFSLFLLCSNARSQTSSNSIQPGSSIVAGSNTSWKSPSAEFAFGFYPLLNGRYLVGIWFDKIIPHKTLVWSLNRDDPAQIGSTINLTQGGHFVLHHANGSLVSIYNQTNNASSASMLDNGNFVLKNSLSNTIWQSFASPTDTILPGQNLVMGQILYSNLNETLDYANQDENFHFLNVVADPQQLASIDLLVSQGWPEIHHFSLFITIESHGGTHQRSSSKSFTEDCGLSTFSLPSSLLPYPPSSPVSLTTIVSTSHNIGLLNSSLRRDETTLRR